MPLPRNVATYSGGSCVATSMELKLTVGQLHTRFSNALFIAILIRTVAPLTIAGLGDSVHSPEL
jgi:hypothetical protein